MKRVHLITIFLLICSIALTSCGKSNNDTSGTIVIDDNTQRVENIKSENDKNEDLVENEDDLNKIQSRLNGLKYEPEMLSKRPIVVSIDNHPAARWQAGISEAEIVYEIEAEAPYTRYLAVFQTASPKLIGPVRSARPYMLYLSLEYDSIFVHCGGSPDAFAKIKSLQVADIDGLYSSALYRYCDTYKKAPHNLYTTIENLRRDAANKKYKENIELEGYSFNSEDTDLDNGTVANKVNILYNKSNSTDYEYDQEKKVYIRYKDNEKHIDENDNTDITAKNIIIYFVDRKVLDNEGRLYLGVIGQGNGYYITNGKAVEITWKKDSETDRTKFYVNDKEISLNPGNIWIQVVNKNAEVTIN